MRTYYIFNVAVSLGLITKDSPYLLYKSFESIYLSKKDDLPVAYNIYEQLTRKMDNNVGQILSSNFKDNQYYMYRQNHHSYYNKYKDEKCTLEIKNSYILCKCNCVRPTLLTKIKGNFFVCDFENKDYFWLDEIYC